MNTFSKTRIAPTPSGYLHAGNAFSFLLTKAIAERTGAKLLLRIDDMDTQRMRPEYVKDIFETLRFLGIEYDEGPRDAASFEKEYTQQYRMPLYQNALQKLANEDLVYACRCSRAELEKAPCNCGNKEIALEEPATAWRLKTGDEEIRVHIFNKDIFTTKLPLQVHDFIVRKKDGNPSYQLSSLVDDVHYGIDLVVRGADLWDSTLTQLYLAKQLNMQDFLTAHFIHHRLLVNDAGEKHSKSAGAGAVRDLSGSEIDLLREDLGKDLAGF